DGRPDHAAVRDEAGAGALPPHVLRQAARSGVVTPEPLLWLDALQGSGIRPGLSRMRALLRELGNPERACPSIIVAGTNGKGSTSSMLASILNASGYRTGRYTSPHLVEPREPWMIAASLTSLTAL